MRATGFSFLSNAGLQSCGRHRRDLTTPKITASYACYAGAPPLTDLHDRCHVARNSIDALGGERSVSGAAWRPQRAWDSGHSGTTQRKSLPSAHHGRRAAGRGEKPRRPPRAVSGLTPVQQRGGRETRTPDTRFDVAVGRAAQTVGIALMGLKAGPQRASSTFPGHSSAPNTPDHFMETNCRS